MKLTRLAKPNDIETIKQLWYENFLEHDTKASIDFYFEHSFDLEYTFVLEENGEIISSLQLNQHTLRLNDQLEDVSFVVGVATFKKYQRQGYMRAILDDALIYARDVLQQRVIILQAYNWDVYRPFGFEERYYKNAITIKYEMLANYENATTLLVGENELLDIYQEYTKSLEGYKIRDEEYYRMQLEMLAIDHISIASSLDAYLFYEVKDEVLLVSECAFKNKNFLYALLKEVLERENLETVEMMVDNENFAIEKKTLFMMSKDLVATKWPSENKLYISEWI